MLLNGMKMKNESSTLLPNIFSFFQYDKMILFSLDWRRNEINQLRITDVIAK